MVGLSIAVGCVATQIKRTVDDNNVFTSPAQPQIKVKISPDFQFMEKKRGSDYGVGTLSGESYAQTKIDLYRFKSRLADRDIFIRIQKIVTDRWYFSQEYIRNMWPKITYDLGNVDIHGNTYDYGVYPLRIQNRGNFIVKTLVRTVGIDNNILLEIHYMQKITNPWPKLTFLSEDKEKILRSFIADSEKDIQILD